MPARHPRLPTLWLMTDERMGDDLWPALRRLPPGAGVVFRHHATPPAARRALYLRVRRLAQARRLVVTSTIDGTHHAHGATTWPAHDRRQAVAARRAGAVLVFVSPVFATRTHPDARALGPMRAARVARGLGMTVIALGGVDARRWRRIARLGFDGWAGIDAFSRWLAITVRFPGEGRGPESGATRSRPWSPAFVGEAA